jgi:hypothetical protein
MSVIMKNIFKILALAWMATFFGCAEPDYPEAQPSVTTQNGRLLPVNTIKDGNALDVVLDNVTATPLFDNLAYGQVVTYKNMQAAPNRLVQYFDATDASLKFTDRFSVVASTAYTTFYYTTNPANAVAIRRLTDNLTTPDVGFAHVRFLNFGKDSPALKLTNVGGGTQYFATRAYADLGANSVNANFTAMTAGTYDFEVRDASNNILLTINGVNLQSKRIYTIFVRGLTGDASLAHSVLTHN